MVQDWMLKQVYAYAKHNEQRLLDGAGLTKDAWVEEPFMRERAAAYGDMVDFIVQLDKSLSGNAPLHRPDHWARQRNGNYPCAECGKAFPCPDSVGNSDEHSF